MLRGPALWKVLPQVVKQMSRMQAMGLVHRDLKPDNLLVGGRGGAPAWAGDRRQQRPALAHAPAPRRLPLLTALLLAPSPAPSTQVSSAGDGAPYTVLVGDLGTAQHWHAQLRELERFAG